MKRPTQADIARALNLSPATVALVVGDSNSSLRQRLSPETIARVERKARELGYTPHRGAQMMRQGRSNLIVLLNCSDYSDLSSRRVYHFGRLVHEAGYDFQVVDAYFWTGNASRMVEYVLGLRPEGVALIGSVQNDFGEEHVKMLLKNGIPFVSMVTSFPGIPRVRYDGRAAFRTLTEWYFNQGRKRVMLAVTSPVVDFSPQVKDRIEGFREAVKARTGRLPAVIEGFDCPQIEERDGITAAVLVSRGRRIQFEPFRSGMEAMESITHWRKLPDAILGINDYFAIGMQTVCSRHGIAVPEEVMISGFDNLTYGTQGPVSLTSVEQPIEEMSEALMGMLRERMGKTPRLVSRAAEKVLPCKIVWRESTAAQEAIRQK